jgi:hypothetical protein
MKSYLILAAAAVALSACGPSEPASAPAPVAPPAPPPLTSAGPFTATQAGVGLITAESRANITVIEKAFPGATAQGTWIEGSTELIPVVSVAGEHDLSMDIMSRPKGTTVGLIVVHAGPVAGPDGETFGSKRSETSLAAAPCEAGKGRYAGKTLCHRPDDAATAYVFDGAGPSAKIVQIRWQVPGVVSADWDKAPLKWGGGKVR